MGEAGDQPAEAAGTVKDGRAVELGGGKQYLRAKLLRYGIAFGVGCAASWFFFVKIPHTIELVVVPELCIMITVLIPVLLWAAVSEPRRAKAIAGIASCVLWVAGIALGFRIPPNSNLIYVPDALMLLGFVPLLHLWRFSWTWLLFGAINFGIGVFLQAIAFMPDNLFPDRLLIAKHHLAQYHPPITWWMLGALSTICGIGRFIFNRLDGQRPTSAGTG